MGSFCLIWNDLIFAPSIGFGYGIELQKKKLVCTQIWMYLSIWLQPISLKKKKKKKKKRIGSPFAFYFNKVLYRFGRWVISTTQTENNNNTFINKTTDLRNDSSFENIWILDETWSILSNPPSLNLQILDMCLARFRKKIHFKRVPTFLFDFFLCNGTIKNLFFSSLFI